MKKRRVKMIHLEQCLRPLFIREIPKDFSSTGIRKSTFKFSKRKEDYDNQLSAKAVGSGSDGISQWNHSASGDMNTERSSYGKVVDESSKTFLCQPNMELKMSKKVLPDSYPTTVKKFLSTGILKGARVKLLLFTGERASWNCKRLWIFVWLLIMLFFPNMCIRFLQLVMIYY